EQDTGTAGDEETDGNETDDDAAAEPEANVVTVGPEERPTMFEPETLTVESGTTVTFEWATDTHNIVLESQPEDGDWDGHEEIEDTGYSHEHTFEADGEYEYICDPHAPDMRGVIVVGSDGTASENGSDANATQ
ncbi:MAG: cupredoxin domain-containing protein, partial [Halovenus sp.]